MKTTDQYGYLTASAIKQTLVNEGFELAMYCGRTFVLGSVSVLVCESGRVTIYSYRTLTMLFDEAMTADDLVTAIALALNA